MCCLLTVLFLLGPRIADIIWWIIAPVRWSTSFGGSFLWPILGIIFLPFTTLMWVMIAPLGMTSMSINPFNWVWIVLAVVLDIGAHTGGGYKNRGMLGNTNTTA